MSRFLNLTFRDSYIENGKEVERILDEMSYQNITDEDIRIFGLIIGNKMNDSAFQIDNHYNREIFPEEEK
jgi:hypothetical protein